MQLSKLPFNQFFAQITPSLQLSAFFSKKQSLCFEQKSIQPIPTTINYHLTEKCNYRCKFCFGNYDPKQSINSLKDCQKIIKLLAEERTFRKINFAGGEPFLAKFLPQTLETAKNLGFRTSIISNGSLITNQWINKNGPMLHQLGISCDTAKESISLQLGRGYGKHVANVKNVFNYLKEYNSKVDQHHQIKGKLNTVVTRLNYQENMSQFVNGLGIERWKIFQILLIKVPEFNEDMIESYLMINPSGCFYQNTNNEYKISQPILKVGVQKALEQVGYSFENFVKRGGLYDI